MATSDVAEGVCDPVSISPQQRCDLKQRRLRVLLVEDNQVNQEIARAVLARAGCSVVLAEDGAQAVAAWQAQTFDLILMDCQMPVMDGIQATVEIRALEASRGTHTPIVALTANALAGDRERCLAAGMDDYLPKPFKQVELVGMLARWGVNGGRSVSPEDSTTFPGMS